MSRLTALRQKLSGGVAGELIVTFLLRFGAAGTSFAFNWLVARSFGPTGTGLWAAALTTIVLLSAVSLMGLDTVVVRTIAKARVDADHATIKAAIWQVVRSAAVMAGLLSLILALFHDPISRLWVKSGAASPYFAIAALTVPILAMTRLASATLRPLGKVALSQLSEGPLSTGLAAVALAAAWAAGLNGWALLPAVLYTAGLAIACTFAWRSLWKIIGTWPVGNPTPMRAAGLAVFGAQVSVYFVEWFATLVLARMGSASEAGIFRVVFQIGSLFSMVMMAGEAVTGPHIAAALRRNDIAKVARLARKTSLALTSASLPLVLGIFLFPEFLLGLFGPGFSEGALALKIIAVAHIANISTGPVSNILLMSGRERLTLIYGLGGAGVSAILSALLIPQWGTTGAAIAVASGIIFRRMAASIIVYRTTGIGLFGRPVRNVG